MIVDAAHATTVAEEFEIGPHDCGPPVASAHGRHRTRGPRSRERLVTGPGLVARVRRQVVPAEEKPNNRPRRAGGSRPTASGTRRRKRRTAWPRLVARLRRQVVRTRGPHQRRYRGPHVAARPGRREGRHGGSPSTQQVQRVASRRARSTRAGPSRNRPSRKRAHASCRTDEPSPSPTAGTPASTGRTRPDAPAKDHIRPNLNEGISAPRADRTS